MIRTTIRNIGDPILKCRTQFGRRCTVDIDVEQPRRANGHDVADHRGNNDTRGVDERADERPEQDPVHHRERIGHRKTAPRPQRQK